MITIIPDKFQLESDVAFVVYEELLMLSIEQGHLPDGLDDLKNKLRDHIVNLLMLQKQPQFSIHSSYTTTIHNVTSSVPITYTY